MTDCYFNIFFSPWKNPVGWYSCLTFPYREEVQVIRLQKRFQQLLILKLKILQSITLKSMIIIRIRPP